MRDDGTTPPEAAPNGSAGADSEGTTLSIRLTVPEMDCPSCAGKVGTALDSVPAVLTYDLRATTGTAVVSIGNDQSIEAVIDAIESAGYAVTGVEGADVQDDRSSDEAGHGHHHEGEHDRGLEADAGSVWRSPRGIATLVAGVLLLAGALLEFGGPALDVEVATMLGSRLSLADVLLLGAIGAGGRVIVRNGYYSFRARSLDIDLLMSVAILAATGVSLGVPSVSLFIEGASIAVLFNVAELLERRAVDQARASIADLADLAPATATVRRDGGSETVSAETVAVGDIVLVGPGERIPVDGTVREGESAVNEAPITGESVPVDKRTGDEVYAGTIAETGYLEVETTAPADDTTLAHVIELVRDASAKKSEREQFVERFSRYYTPIVVTGAIATAAVPPLLF
ncbi:MAG: HAD-IC family P-type ATPase, partial [Halobacteriales archaeon]|nr:HAD-IC family P-type ATPase [Halobacteriales archaeon]